MWDSNLSMYLPPFDTVFNRQAANHVLCVCAVIIALVGLFGALYWRRTGRPIVFFIILGGLTSVFSEPLLDIIGLAWHPVHGQNTAFIAMGRYIPWWVVVNYPAYFGLLVTANYLAFARGISRRGAALWFLIPMLLDIVQEELMMRSNLYYYYGNQLLIWGGKFPLWWGPCNAMAPYLMATILAMMADRLAGWRLLAIPLIMPIAYVVGFLMVGLAAVVAVHSHNLPAAVSDAAGISTFLLSAVTVYVISGLVAGIPRSDQSNNVLKVEAVVVPG